MTETLLILSQIIWTVCAFVPAVMLIVLKRKKKASVRTFFKGAALTFVLHLLLYAGFGLVISSGETDLKMAAVTLVMSVIGFVLFYCVYRKIDTPDKARSRALGVSQLVLLFWCVVCVLGLDLVWGDRQYIPDAENTFIETAAFFLILALVQTAVVLLGISGTYRIYSAEKISGRGKVVLSSLIATVMCFSVFVFGYIRALIF